MNKQKILKCINEGLTLTQTANELNIPKSTLSKFCKKENIQFKVIGKFKIKFSDENIEDIKYFFETGCSAGMLSLLLNVNKYVIERVIKENSLKKVNNTFILNANGRKDFVKDKRALPLEQINNLYVNECNKIMDKIDNIKNNIFKNQYYDKYRAYDLNQEQLEYLKLNFDKKSFKDIAKEIDSNITAVTRAIYSNRLFYYTGYKKRLIITDESFEEDIANKNMSSNMLAEKYNASVNYISKERKRRFGIFKNIYNPMVSRTNIEYIAEEILKDLDISYYFQYDIEKEQVDFYLGHKLIIECYGEYWHSNNEYDKKKIKKLQNLSYKILILHEKDFNNKNNIINLIKNFYYGSLYEVICNENLVNVCKNGVH